MGEILDKGEKECQMYTQDWFSKNLPEILYWVKPHLSGRDSLKILEIGSFEGMSTRWFIDKFVTHKDSVLHCIDTWEGSLEHENWGMDFSGTYEMFIENLKDHIESGKCIPHRGQSKDVLVQLLSEGQKFDFIYVDGSHLAPDVMIDGMLSYLLLNSGGIIMFDDYVFGLHDRRIVDIPYSAIEFIKTSFCAHGRLELLGLNLTATFKKIC